MKAYGVRLRQFRENFTAPRLNARRNLRRAFRRQARQDNHHAVQAAIAELHEPPPPPDEAVAQYLEDLEALMALDSFRDYDEPRW